MKPIKFNHEKLDVYRLALDYTANSFRAAENLAGLHRSTRDQWLRAAQSIPLNIAEGNGKRGEKERRRFFDIARASALECASIHDILVATGGICCEQNDPIRRQLKRIVEMLTKLAEFASLESSDEEIDRFEKSR